jgi:hypothetical protein
LQLNKAYKLSITQEDQLNKIFTHNNHPGIPQMLLIMMMIMMMMMTMMIVVDDNDDDNDDDDDDDDNDDNDDEVSPHPCVATGSLQAPA